MVFSKGDISMESKDSQIVKEALYVEDNKSAEEYINRDDLPSAAKILVDIVEKDPGNWRAFNNMGIISWLKKAWKDAYLMFKRSSELNPYYTDALINLFDAALKIHRVKEILPIFKIAMEKNPGNEEIQIIVEAIETQDEDIYKSERALTIGTYNPNIEEANKLLEEGQLNSAMAKYIEINDKEGPNADAFCGLGIISYYQKRFKDAFTLFYESIKLNPTNTDIYLNFIDAAKECGFVEDAKKVYELYCKEFPAQKKIEDEFEKIAAS